MDIRTAHGTDRENAASDALRAVLADHDLWRWMFTDLITIDQTIRGGVSAIGDAKEPRRNGRGWQLGPLIAGERRQPRARLGHAE